MKGRETERNLSETKKIGHSDQQGVKEVSIVCIHAFTDAYIILYCI